MSGETTTTLDEEMLEESPRREAVQAVMQSLAARGLLTTERGTCSSFDRVFEDDWWDVTTAGREAIGLPPHRRLPR